MKEWRCKTCGVTYTPDPPDYTCPECGSGNTVPEGYEPPEGHEIPEARDEPERHCPECGSAMRCGYLVETNTPLTLLTLGERVALKAYACPGCGHIGLYARRMDKQRALIEKAAYTCQ